MARTSLGPIAISSCHKLIDSEQTYICTSSHSGLDIIQNADIIWELLFSNTHLDTPRSVQVATKMSGSPEKCLVSFDFP